jgi:hypothetical protein
MILVRSPGPLEFGVSSASGCATFGLDLHVTQFEKASDFGDRAEIDGPASKGITRDEGFPGEHVILDLCFDGTPHTQFISSISLPSYSPVRGTDRPGSRCFPYHG